MTTRQKSASVRPRRTSGLRLEALEARQLLAVVSGGGTEVGSNILHPNGNVYDQVLMTGSSVTVSADAGQVTRVSFLDLDGDIVQAEFSGKGTLTISLDQFKAAAAATHYNQPGVNYVGGLASFTIAGEDATTNFSVFSVGSVNAVNQSLFAGGKTGGNNYADIALLTVVGEPGPDTSASTMGGIRAGNAIFSGSEGVIGISATNVDVRDAIIIGDVDATGSATPYLRFGDSQVGTLTLSGGDLVQSNNAALYGGGFATLNSTNGQTSAGVNLPALVPSAAATVVLDAKMNQSGIQRAATMITDTSTAFNLTGLSQADITALFAGRTFANDVTISGDLASNLSLSAAEFRGGLTFAGKVAGAVSVDSGVKHLVLNQGFDGTFKTSGLGDVSASGIIAGTISAKSIGNVQITGDLAGTLSTDFDGNGLYSSGEKAIGNVTITGNDSGRVIGVLGIGNISIGGDVTGGTATGSATPAAGDKFVTLSSATASATDASYKADIGTIAIGGDVDLSFSTTDAGIANLVNLNRGTFGNITVSGAGALHRTDLAHANFLGGLRVNTALTARGGNFAVSDDASLILGEIRVAGASAFGDISVTTTTSAAGATLATTSSTQNSASFDAGAITLAGAERITLNAFAARTIGNVSAATTDTPSSKITLAGALNGSVSIGDVTLNAGTQGTIAWGADIGASSAGAAASKVGAVTAKAASTTIDSSVGIVALGGLASFTATGDVTFGAVGASANFELGGASGALAFNGVTTFGAAKSDIPVILADDGTAALDTIKSITFGGRVVGGANTEIRASAIGDVSIKSSLIAGQQLVSDLNILVTNNGDATAANAETVARDGSNLANYSLGNITVQSTDTVGIVNTALFSGSNTFFALGKMGNISLLAGGSSTVRTSLFGSPAAAGAGAAFVVGDGDNTLDNKAGIDFDGDATIGTITHNSGITAAQESAATFSAPTSVSIGDIRILAAGGGDRLIGAGGNSTGADGLLVLAGVKAVTGTTFTASGLVRSDANLRGTIGSIEVSDGNVLPSLSTANYTTTTANPPTAGIIAAAGPATDTGVGSSNIGKLNGVAVTFDTANTSRVLGNDGTDVTLTDASVNEIVVIRI